MGPWKCEQIVKTVSDLGWKEASIYPSCLSKVWVKLWLSFTLLLTENLEAHTSRV